MKHKNFRTTFSRAILAAAFAALATTAQAVFVSGNFDPPDLSGTHTFELLGTDCLTGTGPRFVNDPFSNNCTVSLNRLTVTLDDVQPLDTSAITFRDFGDIWGINVVGGQVVGVDTFRIGGLTGPAGPYQGPWWIEYDSGARSGYFSDPVYLFDCNSHESRGAPADLACLRDIAPTVTFFLSDANGNPLSIPEPGSLVLVIAALAAGWTARRKLAA